MNPKSIYKSYDIKVKVKLLIVKKNSFQVGVTSKVVHSEDETMKSLKGGAFNRTTASTNMNDQVKESLI